MGANKKKMATPIKGVESIEIFPISADGKMPTSGGMKIQDIQDESVNINIPNLETIKEYVEDKDGVRYVFAGRTEGITVASNSIDVNGEIAAKLTGGTWTPGATGKEEFGEFAAPAKQDIVYLAIKITSKPFMGKKMVFNVVNMAVSFGTPGPLTGKGMFAIGFTGESQTPVNAAGIAQSPWGWKIEEVLPEG